MMTLAPTLAITKAIVAHFLQCNRWTESDSLPFIPIALAIAFIAPTAMFAFDNESAAELKSTLMSPQLGSLLKRKSKTFLKYKPAAIGYRFLTLTTALSPFTFLF